MNFCLLVVVVVVVSVTAQPQPCCTPDQWSGIQASITGTVKNGQPESTEAGTMVYYDYTNQRLAAITNVTTAEGPVVQFVLSVYNSQGGTQYLVDLLKKSCVKSQLTTPMQKACVPSNAKPDGMQFYYGGGAEKLTAQRFRMDIQPGMLSGIVTVTPDLCIPVTEVVYGVVDSTTGDAILQAIEFNNVTPGITRPDIFNVPTECQQAVHLPPVVACAHEDPTMCLNLGGYFKVFGYIPHEYGGTSN